jgi:hypothetical protein
MNENRCTYLTYVIGKYGQCTGKGTPYCPECSPRRCFHCGKQATHDCRFVGTAGTGWGCAEPICDDEACIKAEAEWDAESDEDMKRMLQNKKP